MARGLSHFGQYFTGDEAKYVLIGGVPTVGRTLTATLSLGFDIKIRVAMAEARLVLAGKIYQPT